MLKFIMLKMLYKKCEQFQNLIYFAARLQYMKTIHIYMNLSILFITAILSASSQPTLRCTYNPQQSIYCKLINDSDTSKERICIQRLNHIKNNFNMMVCLTKVNQSDEQSIYFELKNIQTLEYYYLIIDQQYFSQNFNINPIYQNPKALFTEMKQKIDQFSVNENGVIIENVMIKSKTKILSLITKKIKIDKTEVMFIQLKALLQKNQQMENAIKQLKKQAIQSKQIKDSNCPVQCKAIRNDLIELKQKVDNFQILNGNLKQNNAKLVQMIKQINEKVNNSTSQLKNKLNDSTAEIKELKKQLNQAISKLEHFSIKNGQFQQNINNKHIVKQIQQID